MISPRFNLSLIQSTLESTQASFESINQSLDVKRHALSEQMTSNLLAGYALVDSWLGSGVDLFALGNSGLVLELNTLVLCGSDPQVRAEYEAHILENKKHFYDDSNAGIGALVEWYQKHLSEDIYQLAAGMYVQMISHPQLFLEGNHRTAILVISYLLGRHGLPPFVLTAANAKSLLDQSAEIENLKKNSIGMMVHFNSIRGQLAAVLQHSLDGRHLLLERQAN